MRFSLHIVVNDSSVVVNDCLLLLCTRKQGNKLRRLMTFAWPCLLSKNCVDPATKYHGHLLLSHIIAKFAIHKRIVLQVSERLVTVNGYYKEMLEEYFEFLFLQII